MRRWVIVVMLLVPLPSMEQELSFSHPSGFYGDTFRLVIGATGFLPDCTVRYTLNGSTPTLSSCEYHGPIAISEDCLSQSDIFKIQNCIDTHWRVLSNVERIVVVRAALVDTLGRLRSKVQSAAYVVQPLMGRSLQLPVVSVCTDSAALFDYDTGIFVRGRYFDPAHECCTGNYFQKGRAWERRCSFSFLEPGGASFTRDCGLRIHGNSQRTLGQKGFALYARQDYGSKRFDYRFFPGRSQSAYKRLVLRPWCSSWSGAGVEDWLAQQLAEPLLCDNMASRPVVLFLNGEYWGIYFLEEKPDEHYVEEHYGYDDDIVDVLSYWDGAVESGSADRWLRLYEWLKTADLTVDTAYQYLARQIDIPALTDYMLAQIYFANVDWPANNVRFFSAAGSPWRWLFFDADASFAVWRSNDEMLGYITCNDSSMSYPSSPSASLLFRRLLERNVYRQAAFRRLRQLVDGPWSYISAKEQLDSIRAIVAPEVGYQIARFPKPADMEAWEKAMDDIDLYLLWHPVSATDDFAEFFSASVQSPCRIRPNPSAAEAMLHVEADHSGEVGFFITDAVGRRVAEERVSVLAGHNAIRLPSLPHGMYFLWIEDDEKPMRWIVAQ